MFDFVISLVMLCAAILSGAAIMLFRRGNRKQASLMALLAFVMMCNIVIWILPTSDGDTLADHAASSD